MVAGGRAAITGPDWVEIFEVGATPQLLPVFTNLSCVIDSTDLFVRPGSYIAQSSGAKRIGQAAQTVNRSVTKGVVQAILSDAVSRTPLVTASSRTAVQLPTAAIWDNFPLADMRNNPFLGALLDTDFRGGTPWFNSFVDATYAASAAGKTPTEHIFIGPLGIGELALFSTTDNQAAELQFPVAIPASGTGIWGFEVRIKQSVITNARGNYFAGLMAPSQLGGDLISDTGTMADVGCIGFQLAEGDGDAVNMVYDKAGQAQQQHSAGFLVPVATTYDTLGLYYNGTTIAMYKNGVAHGTAVSAANIAAATFPEAVVMVPTLAVKNAHADDFTATVDWIRAAWIA